MQAHLGNAAPNQLGPLSTMKKGAICAGSRAAAADADLELAIALSKQSLDEVRKEQWAQMMEVFCQ